MCDRSVHFAKDCKIGNSHKKDPFKSGAVQKMGIENLIEESSGLESCIQNNKLLLLNDTKLPIVKSAGLTTPGDIESKMPVVKGKVGDPTADTLREKKDQYTFKYCYMLLIDNTVHQVPIAKIQLDNPYLKGELELQCLPDPIYELIIGNVEGAKVPEKPDPDWQEACAVTTRAQAKESK